MRRAALVTIIVGCCGAVFILLGGLLGWVAFPAIIEDTVAETVAVKNGTDAWDRWIELPLPMQMKVRIFHITNPEAITNGAQPEYEERGPYVYTETRAKEDIELHEDEDRASYFQRSLFHFDAAASNGSEDDYVMVPNIPLVSFAQITENIEPLAKSIKSFNSAVHNLFQNQVGIFTNVTVHDYLFGQLPMNCTFYVDDHYDLTFFNEMLMCSAYSLVAPKTVIINDDGVNFFSFFAYKNDSTDGRYEVKLGISDVENIGQVILWENETSTDKWGDDACNLIQGTDSTIFRPNLNDVDHLYIYNTDICRTVKLTYKEDTEFRDIAGRRYVADKNVFASAVNNPDNYCYCPQTVNNLTARGGCLKDGLLELSSCQGAPVVLSHPHFLFGDQEFLNYNPTLHPVEEKHQIFLDLDPYTGSPLRGASRIQMNILLKQIKEVDMMAKFQGHLLPVLWMEEGVELNDELVQMLHDELLDKLDILEGVRWALIAVGIAMLCGSLIYYVLRLR